MSNGKVTGHNYDGGSKVGVMSKYIHDTIGEKCWGNMSNKLKAQIYSFCFQSDTDIPYKMKFIAGLANAIDSNINRGSIVNKPINDVNVKNAIDLIKSNCSNINGFYDNYLKIIDAQYKSMDFNDNYRFIWKYRPIAIDRIMGGEDINDVLNDWEKFNNGGQTTPNQNSNQNPNQKIIKKIQHDYEPTKLTAELKGLGVIYNPDIISRPEEVIVKYQKTGDNPVSLSFVYSNADEKEKVLDKVKETNTIEREINYSMNGYDGYIIVIKR
jgi:hypothetical protein